MGLLQVDLFMVYAILRITIDKSHEGIKMKSNGISYQAKNRRQNKPDGKLFLINRLCPGALLLADPIGSRACPLCHRDSFISAVFRVPEFTRSINKLCRYGSGVAFLSLSQTQNGTNGISTCRMTETSVCMVTAITTGARQDIIQKGNNDGGDSKRYVIEYWMSRAKTYSNAEAPHYVY